jgi:hypothetical protein
MVQRLALALDSWLHGFQGVSLFVPIPPATLVHPGRARQGKNSFSYHPMQSLSLLVLAVAFDGEGMAQELDAHRATRAKHSTD